MKEGKRFYPRPEDRELPDSTGKKQQFKKSKVVNLGMEEIEEKELQKKSKKKNLDSNK